MMKLPRTIIVYIGSLILMGLLVALKFNSLPPQIPLFYSLPDSDNQVVDTWLIASIPLLSFIFINVNNFLGKRVFQRNLFILKVVYLTNLTIIVFFTYIFFRIILLIS